MADIITDGKTKVSFVEEIADIAAPTTTELEAGVSLEAYMTPDGLVGFEPETADVDASSLNSTFDTKRAGRASFSGTLLRLKKQSGTDTPYETLQREVEGYVVVRRGLDANAPWANGQDVEVYPVQCGQTRMLPPEPNTMQRYEVPVKIHTEPELRAVVGGASSSN